MILKVLAFIYRNTGILLFPKYVDKVYDNYIKNVDISDMNIDGIEQTALFRSSWEAANRFVITYKMLKFKIRFRRILRLLRIEK